MNRPGRDPGKEKVVSFRAKGLPVVVTLPSRLHDAEGRGAAVLQMPACFHQTKRKAPVVLQMPSPAKCIRRRAAAVVEMPSQTEDNSETHEANSAALSNALRMTLVALFALLGWPRPTHGKDPGAAGARPWKLELLNVISNLQVPVARSGRLAARGAMLKVPRSMAGEVFSVDLAKAA